MLTIERQREARRKALRLLEVKDRTRRELKDKFKSAGFTEEETEDALAYAASYGYLDDERYARTFIAFRRDTKSKQAIFRALMQKGIARPVIEAAWEAETEFDSHDERRIIEKELRKRCQEGECLDQRELRRLLSRMAYRGFQMEDVFAVMEELGISRDSREDRA